MAVINDKYRFMFLCEPHTASRTIRDALMKLEGSRETSTYHHCDVRRALHNNYLTQGQVSDYGYFATIRDPHDLLVTKWFITTPRRDDFYKFLRGHKKNLKNGTLFWRFLDSVTHMIRYEKLEEGLNQVLAKYNAPLVELPEAKPDYKTPGKTTWQDEWSGRLFNWAAMNYPDINRYGYQHGYNLAELAPVVKPVTD
jgi:hypothetical protein